MLRKARETKLRLIQEANKRLMNEEVGPNFSVFSKIESETDYLAELVQSIEENDLLKKDGEGRHTQGKELADILRKIEEVRDGLQKVQKDGGYYDKQ